MESTWSRLDALQPVNVTPSFPQPMYEPLRELFQDMVLPGLEQIPNNSLTVLQVNARFIEAYMVGLNHELSRELLVARVSHRPGGHLLPAVLGRAGIGARRDHDGASSPPSTFPRSRSGRARSAAICAPIEAGTCSCC